jgi:6-phosphogluconolactonase (cycloisomerase 2 family)
MRRRRSYPNELRCRSMDSTRAFAATLSTALVTIVLGALAQAADARVVYVTNHNSGTVSALRMAADGSLAPVAGSPFAAVSMANGLSIAPDGSTLIAARFLNPGALTAFTPSLDGTLTSKAGAPPASGNVPSYSTIGPSGRFLYVSNASGLVADRTISGFALAGASMPTSLGPAFPGGGVNMAGIATSVDGRFVYAGHNSGPGNVRGYSVAADGQLTGLPGSPFSLGVGSSQSIVMSPDGRFAYVGDQENEKVAGAAIGADGALTPVGTPIGLGTASTNPENLAMTPDGRWLFSANRGPTTTSISVFAVAADGTLTAAPGSPLALTGPPTGIAVTPDGRRLYTVLASAGTNLLGYSIGGNGVLTALPGSPWASGGDNAGGSVHQSLAIAPDQGPSALLATTVKGSTATFSGTGSNDPDGSVAVYEWAFGDGKTATSTTPEVKHTYVGDGSYEATLRVVDDEGCSATRIYTGQATLCNSGPAALAAATVVVNLPPVVSKQTVKKRSVKGKLKGLTVGFRISETATAKVAVERKSAGRRVNKRCVKPKRANRGKPKCDRYSSVLARAVKAKQAGPVSLKLGKKAVKRLKPGSYRVAITARDTTGKRTVKPVYKTFKIAKPKPRRG